MIMLVDFSLVEVDKVRLIYVLGFMLDDELLLMESEGEFIVEEMK